jgi:hypothetical protein
VDDYQDAARRIVQVLGDPGAREFLTLLESNDTVRADAFLQLYERGETTRCSTLCTISKRTRSCAGGWPRT